jgi:hypothetical protein
MFGWTRIATLAAVAAVLAMATGVAGATSKPGGISGAGSHLTRAGKITSSTATRAALLKAANLRTRAGAARYLRSIGLKASHLVIQRGIRNYAGANCPGKGWSCTSTAHPVVQIAAAGGFNTFQCSTASCAVVQVAAPAAKPANSAVCIKTTGLSQSCSISQSGSTANNLAVVYESTSKLSGLTQTALATAQITQRASTSGANTACVYQNIAVDGSNGVAKKGTPVSVTLNAHQSVSVTQDSASGANVVQNAMLSGTTATCNATDPGGLTQNQKLTSGITGSASITQNENATDTGPNVSLDIEQNQSPGFLNSATGPNTSAFTQNSTLTAIASTTPGGPVSQTQSSPNGGLLATINQFSHDHLSTSAATQNETQCEHAQTSGAFDTNNCVTTAPQVDPLSQVQYGPIRKGLGTSTQGDFSGDTFTVNQSSTQKNDTGLSQTNTLEGDCSTSGNCTVSQDTNIDGSASHNVQSGSDVSAQTTCSGTNCSGSGPGFLTITPTGLSVSNTDIGEFGVGGMRGGDGIGSITASGITGPVTHAFLYWHGPTNSADPASNAAVTFNGTPITGTNIGTADDNNWGFQNSQAYRADVTSLVSGDGPYSLSDFVKPGTADINGVSLIVFYNDGNTSNDRNVVAWNGNDSNVAFGADPANWDETISGVPYPGAGSATLDLVVADGQSFEDGALVVNGTTIEPAGPIFQGDSTPPNTVDGLWDMKSFDITSVLTQPTNSLHLTSPANLDALSLVVAIANVPAAAPVIG